MDEKSLGKLSKDFFELIMQLHKDVVKPDDLMKGLNIPPSHGKVIFYLAHKGPSSVSTIAKDLCISRPNMTPIIDKLLETGYVNRYEDPNDRRVLRIEITEKAHTAFRMKRDLMMDLLKDKLSTLNDEDLKSLDIAMSEFSRILSNLK